MILKHDRICYRCRKSQSLECYGKRKDNRDGVNTICKACNASMAKEYRIKNPDRAREAQKRSRTKHAIKNSMVAKAYVLRLKDRVFTMYGNKCACCGESRKEFFALDHKNGGGTQERRRLGTRGLLFLAVKEGFPKDKYQLLCHNCNMSLGFFGYCPHRPEIRRPVLKKFIPKT